MDPHQGMLKYECDVCSKKFVTKERLFAHRRLHLGKRFLCSRCDFKARSSTSLRNHIIMKHSERRFQCFLCSKKFGSKQNLEQHGVVHTGMTSWHCSICEMSFKRHHHFKAHLQRLILLSPNHSQMKALRLLSSVMGYPIFLGFSLKPKRLALLEKTLLP